MNEPQNVEERRRLYQRLQDLFAELRARSVYALTPTGDVTITVDVTPESASRLTEIHREISQMSDEIRAYQQSLAESS